MPHTVSGNKLLQILKENGVQPYNEIVIDATYVLVTKEWIEYIFSEAFVNFLKQFKLIKYKSEKNDCDNFALHCHSFALILHQNSEKVDGKGFAIGQYHYNQDTGGGHGINFWVTVDKEDSGKYQVLFYEPQTREIITLSEQEKASCRTVFF